MQNVIPGLIEPFPLLALIVTCLVGDQQPFACVPKNRRAMMAGVAILEPMPPLSKECRVKRAIIEPSCWSHTSTSSAYSPVKTYED